MGASESLGTFVSLIRGTTYKGVLVGSPGPALLGLGSITPGGGFREGDFKTYGGDCPEKLLLGPGDLFVSLKGATKDGEMIGSIARVPTSVPSGRLTQDTVKLDFKSGSTAFRSYIYWLLRTPHYRQYCAARATGSAVVALSRDDFLAYAVPPLDTARGALVTLFDAVEEKIRLNRRMCQTLEEMARALFKSWFVDFDPVRAKMEGRDPGLPKEIADLFPSRLVDSELGPIPEGWRVAAVSEHFNISIGRTPPRKEPEWFSERESDVPWLSIKDLGDVSVFAWRTSEFLTAEAVERFRVPIIPAGTVVLSFKLTVGRVAITSRVMLSNEAIAHFLPKQDCPTNSAWMLCYLRQYSFGRLGSTSSIATAVNSESIRTMPILYPLAGACATFAEIVRPMFDRIQQLDHETRTLAALRDTLLPKLISGELRVPASLGTMQEVVS